MALGLCTCRFLNQEEQVGIKGTVPGPRQAGLAKGRLSWRVAGLCGAPRAGKEAVSCLGCRIEFPFNIDDLLLHAGDGVAP